MVSPLPSIRLRISPIRRRWTPSGLINTRVRSVTADSLAGRRLLPGQEAVLLPAQHFGAQVGNQ